MGQIVAMGGGGFLMDDPLLDRFVCGLVERPRLRICLIPTASGDHPSVIDAFHVAFPDGPFDPSVLELFDRSVDDISGFLTAQDVIYVGGGNTVSMLAVWRAHGVDVALRAAAAASVVLTGMSAGANCWFEACTTDSYQLGRADALLDGLEFVAGSFTPHLDSEPARQAAATGLIGSGALPHGYVCEDFAAIHVVDGEVREAVASRPGGRVFRVEPDGMGGVRATPLEVRTLS